MPSLADMREGQSAKVIEITGNDSIATRLMEMGLTDGESIQLIGFAPMGDPLEISIRGYRLSLRKIEAQRVLVDFSE